LGRGQKDLDSALKSGSVPQFPDPMTGRMNYIKANGEPVRYEATVTTDRQNSFGESFIKQYSGQN
jgi:hypothetical protein